MALLREGFSAGIAEDVLEEAGAEGLFKEACGSVLEGVIPGDESAKARRGAKDEIMRFDDSD